MSLEASLLLKRLSKYYVIFSPFLLQQINAKLYYLLLSYLLVAILSMSQEYQIYLNFSIWLENQILLIPSDFFQCLKSVFRFFPVIKNKINN
jgi:hypothetical protein